MKPMIAIFLLGLAACNRLPPNAVPTDSAVASSARNEAAVDASLGGIVAVDNDKPVAGVPVEKPKRISDVRRDAREFPTAFLGKWGLTDADCDLSRVDDATGMMSIDALKVHFYGGTATVRAMPSKSAYDLVADLDFKGDGKAWQRRERFALQTAGIALIRTEPAGPGTPARAFRYERC